MSNFVELRAAYFAILHDDDSIALAYGVETVSYRQHGAVPESLTKCSLYQCVGLGVDGCRRFVQEQHLERERVVLAISHHTEPKVMMPKTLLRRRRARAMHKSCLSPTEKLSPFSTTILCSRPGRALIMSFIFVRSSASHRASSEYIPKGSKLYL